MATSWQFVLLLVLCSIAFVCEAAKEGDDNPCSVEQAVRLDAAMENATCGYVEGRVEICEGGQWKLLCDTQWTKVDAGVTCRSLNYTATGALNRTKNQVSSGTSESGFHCSGEESSTTQCTLTSTGSDDNGDCTQAVSVLCFVDESRTSMAECVLDTTTGSPGTTSPTTSSAGGTTSPPPSSTAQPTTTASSPTTSPLTGSDQSKGFFSPPTLYYFVGGLSAVILAIVLLVVMVIAICCCGCWSRKLSLSHTNPEQPEKAGQIQVPYSEESQKAKEQEALAHHQIQQSSAQPIYEAIHDGSSTDSQGSPCSKPLMSPNSAAEVYSTLDNAQTYAQIQPHIAVRGVLSTPVTHDPDPNTNYQVLNHGRTQSLKRDHPNRPQAVNPTALALVDGRVSERDLANQTSTSSLSDGHSRSLPRSTGHRHHSNASHPRSHPHPPPTPPSERVPLQNLASEATSNEETNFYHILEPPPQYGNLEQINEYSQVPNSAASHTSTSSHSPPFSPKYSHQRYPDSSYPHHPPHPRSATLPSNSSSSPRSRTSSQSSNSPQTNRQNKSPQISRIGGNRFTDSPGSTRGASSSPNVNISKVSNRLSAQSGHSDNNDIQSNFSERSGIDTLV